MSTGLVYDERFLEHEAPYPHPEHPARVSAIWSALTAEGLDARCVRVPARPATDAELHAVHTAEYVSLVDQTKNSDFGQLDPDTYTNRRSAEVARLAAGATVDATLGVYRGDLTNAFVVVRPPGHHAEAGEARGFCLFNNVAIAAEAARAAGAERIAIFDWDLHHGNGTQHIFYDDPDVFYLSTHQYPYYPGTGAIGETGRGPGAGRTLNIPWPGGMGDAEYLAAFSEIILPAMREFSPHLVLVSAGFDAVRGDPLGAMEVSAAGFARMAGEMMGLADGKLVLVLEGGYAHRAMGVCAVACMRVLLGESPPETVSPAPGRAAQIIERIRQRLWG